MSFPALALAVTAAHSVTRYSGIRPMFVTGLNIRWDECNSTREEQPVFYVSAETIASAYFDAGDVTGVDPAIRHFAERQS